MLLTSEVGETDYAYDFKLSHYNVDQGEVCV